MASTVQHGLGSHHPQSGINEEYYSSDEDDDTGYEGTELQRSLAKALDHDFSSSFGDFFHAGIQTFAPNPCIVIKGLEDFIGLPLSSYDAKRIISVASLAPFGHGENIAVDKAEQDIWEVAPEKLTFVNPAWQKFIGETVCAEVCAGLGVCPSTSKMELSKLFLYEAGSHYSPHQDTQKANGTFATVIIILPSAYKGGQLVVSHASTSKTVDFSKQSPFATAVLAWYTDVRHEVKPITSGFRLALSFNLIHTSRSPSRYPTPIDVLRPVKVLEKVLRTWKQQLDSHKSEQHIIAYLLDHQYSPMNLRSGQAILKGMDAHLVQFVRHVAESIGFITGLATLNHYVTGDAEADNRIDDFCTDYMIRRSECPDMLEGRELYENYLAGGRMESPEMLEVDSVSTELSSLTGMDGKPLLGLTNSIDIPEESLIPANPFEDLEPDRKEYEGDGDGGGSVEHWYERTVLVIVNASNRTALQFEVQGLPFAFDLLEKNVVNPPSADNLEWSSLVLRKRSSWTKDNLMTMLKNCLQWKTADLWTESVKCPLCSVESVGSEILLKSCLTFSFDLVRTSFEEILARSKSEAVVERVQFILALTLGVGDRERTSVILWSQKEMQNALASFTPKGTKDVPTIVAVIKDVGLKQFTEHMLPNLCSKSSEYNFWQTLLNTLLEQRQDILDHLSSHSHTPISAEANALQLVPGDMKKHQWRMLRSVLVECLSMACKDVLNVKAPPEPRYHYSSSQRQTPSDSFPTRLERTLLLVKRSIKLSSMDSCDRLLQQTLGMSENLSAKFTKFYFPLILSLMSLLTRYNKSMTMVPFAPFIRKLIGGYLADVLCEKGRALPCGLRKVGCGCGDCAILDRFTESATDMTTTITMNKSRRNHLEDRLRSATDLCTVEQLPYGGTHSIRLHKKPAIVWACTWSARRDDIISFLTSLGGSNTVFAIMGSRYNDVCDALEGKQYVLDEQDAWTQA